MLRTDHMGIKTIGYKTHHELSTRRGVEGFSGNVIWKFNIYKEMSNKLALKSIWENVVALLHQGHATVFYYTFKMDTNVVLPLPTILNWILHLYWLLAEARTSSLSAVANRNTHHEDISLICCLCQQHPVIYKHEKCAGSFSASLREAVTLNAS